jgi:hypothetical protein
MNRATDLRLRRLERVGAPGEIVSAVLIRARTAAEAEGRLSDMRASGELRSRAPLIVLTGAPDIGEVL